MLKWVKSLFSPSESDSGHDMPGWFDQMEAASKVSMPEVKPPKAEDISEPVYAIIKNIEKHPGRWKVRVTDRDYNPGAYTSSTKINYEVKDKTTDVIIRGSVIKFCEDPYSCSDDVHYSEIGTEFSWLTLDEKKALHDAFRSAYSRKKKRREDIQKAGYNKQREKWKEIYCE